MSSHESVSNAISAVEKLKGQKTLADIAHFESCARGPLQKCHGSGVAFFFSLSKMMAVKPSHVGEVKLDDILLEKGYTSLFVDSCVLNCSGSFSTSSPECPVQSSLLACEYRVKRRTWVQ